MRNRFIQTRHNLTVVINGESKIISTSHPNFKTVLRLVTQGRWKAASGYLEIKQAIKTASSELRKGLAGVLKAGGATKADLAGLDLKALADLQAGTIQDLEPFYARCKANPSAKSVVQLLAYLQYIRAPILPDGCFLGYKAVRSDFKDLHSGTFDNSPGKIVSMPRVECNSNPNETCSSGLHVGALEYVHGTYRKGGSLSGNRFVLVKVDPADVVSVPTDYSGQKMRTCRYEVLRELKYGE